MLLSKCNLRLFAITIPAALVLVAGLSACSLRPVHMPRGDAAAPALLMSEIAIAPIPERSGQMLRNALMDRLTPHGAAPDPRWRLHVNFGESIRKLGMRKDLASTRAQLRVSANYKLIDSGDGETIFDQGDVRAIASYNIQDSEYTTLVAERNARERAINALADDLADRLALHFAVEAPQPVLPDSLSIDMGQLANTP